MHNHPKNHTTVLSGHYWFGIYHFYVPEIILSLSNQRLPPDIKYLISVIIKIYSITQPSVMTQSTVIWFLGTVATLQGGTYIARHSLPARCRDRAPISWRPGELLLVSAAAASFQAADLIAQALTLATGKKLPCFTVSQNLILDGQNVSKDLWWS